ncbi:hypothetical protein [Rhizobacter fulvus]
MLYLIGNAFYKRVVYGWFPPSHVAGIALLAVMAPAALATSRLVTGATSSIVLVIVSIWQSRHPPRPPV